MQSKKSYRSSVEAARKAAITPDDTISFSWGTVVEGGFRIDNAVLVLSSDGRGYFQGLVQSELPNNNTLTVSGFGLHDANGLELFRSPPMVLTGGFEDPTQNSESVFHPAYMYGYVTNCVLYY